VIEYLPGPVQVPVTDNTANALYLLCLANARSDCAAYDTLGTIAVAEERSLSSTGHRGTDTRSSPSWAPHVTLCYSTTMQPCRTNYRGAWDEAAKLPGID
jgi:hypothetical protein